MGFEKHSFTTSRPCCDCCSAIWYWIQHSCDKGIEYFRLNIEFVLHSSHSWVNNGVSFVSILAGYLPEYWLYIFLNSPFTLFCVGIPMSNQFHCFGSVYEGVLRNSVWFNCFRHKWHLQLIIVKFSPISLTSLALSANTLRGKALNIFAPCMLFDIQCKWVSDFNTQ